MSLACEWPTRKISQEICFVAAGEHADFVRRRGGDEDRAGQIVTTDGTVVGRHDGIEGFTIGQRKGIGVALGEPRYVVRLEGDTHRVVIGSREDLARDSFTARQANWLADPPAGPLRCLVQIRYSSRPAPALIEPLDDDRLRISPWTRCTALPPARPSFATTATVCSAGDGSRKSEIERGSGTRFRAFCNCSFFDPQLSFLDRGGYASGIRSHHNRLNPE